MTRDGMKESHFQAPKAEFGLEGKSCNLHSDRPAVKKIWLEEHGRITGYAYLCAECVALLNKLGN